MSFVSNPISYDPAMRQLLEVQRECKEKSVDPSIQEGIDKVIKLMKDRQTYCENISSTPSDVLKQVSRKTWAHPFTEAYKAGKTAEDLNPRMLTGILKGNFLQSFISASKATRVLEIGMYTGYSALTLAEALPEDGKVVTLDKEPYLEPIARGYCDRSPHGKKVDIRIGPGNETLKALAKENQKFEVVFIDADKEGYKDYYKTIMETNLLAPGGSIIFDNALFYGSPYMDTEKEFVTAGCHVTACNEFLRSQNDIHRVLLPIRDGIMIIRRKNEPLRSQ